MSDIAITSIRRLEYCPKKDLWTAYQYKSAQQVPLDKAWCDVHFPCLRQVHRVLSLDKKLKGKELQAVLRECDQHGFSVGDVGPQLLVSHLEYCNKRHAHMPRYFIVNLKDCLSMSLAMTAKDYWLHFSFKGTDRTFVVDQHEMEVQLEDSIPIYQRCLALGVSHEQRGPVMAGLLTEDIRYLMLDEDTANSIWERVALCVTFNIDPQECYQFIRNAELLAVAIEPASLPTFAV